MRDDGLRRPWGAIVAFLLPALTIYVAFTAYPVVRTLWNSAHKVLPRREVFVGLENYAALAQDEIFWRSVRNTITWASISPLAEVSVALILALALYAKVPGARFFRIAWFTPVLMSYIVVGILWVWIYNFDWGPVNAALRALGLGGLAKAWLGNPNTALPSLIVVTTWMWIGFNMVVLLAALHSLPREVIEAAELDNCGWGQKLVYVILPLIWPTRAQPPRAVVHRQDEDLRPGLDHHQRRPAVVDRDRLDLRLQARLRVVDVRPRLSVDHRGDLVRHRARHRAHADLGAAPARASSNTERAWRSRSSTPLLLILLAGLHGVCGRTVRVGRDHVAAHDHRDHGGSFRAADDPALGEIPDRLVQLELQRLFQELRDDRAVGGR